jgi:hypothetical protein
VSEVIVGYLPHPGRGTGSGMRVLSDGTVELAENGGPWRPVAQLTPDELAQLESHTREAGIPDLPPEVAAPEGMRDGTSCEWWTDLDGRSHHSLIHGWADDNPAAAPSRKLVMDLYALVAAAQARA